MNRTVFCVRAADPGLSGMKVSRPSPTSGQVVKSAKAEAPPLTLADIPPPHTRRWVARRKAQVIAAIEEGLLTEAEACRRYQLSVEELELWRQSLERAGVPGLRVTRIQMYRDTSPAS